MLLVEGGTRIYPEAVSDGGGQSTGRGQKYQQPGNSYLRLEYREKESADDCSQFCHRRRETSASSANRSGEGLAGEKVGGSVRSHIHQRVEDHESAKNHAHLTAGAMRV